MNRYHVLVEGEKSLENIVIKASNTEKATEYFNNEGCEVIGIELLEENINNYEYYIRLWLDLNRGTEEYKDVYKKLATMTAKGLEGIKQLYYWMVKQLYLIEIISE